MLINELRKQLDAIYCAIIGSLDFLNSKVNDLGKIVNDLEKLTKEDKEGSEK